jgi:D-alanyl-D-alanine dipeptidase
MKKTDKSLPDNFIYLDEFEPSIVQSIAYASSENFVGQPLDGYKAARAIITTEAAIALQKVQRDVEKDGYSLVVYDAYRPQKTVDHFMRWSLDATDLKMQGKYYPYVDKNKVFELGYIAEKSSHSRGSTVDLSIIKLGQKITESNVVPRILNDGREVAYLDDGSVDMYTSFDLFDEASWHDTPLIPAESMANRGYLREKMLEHNFQEYQYEWWHYTLKDEPFPKEYFNFDVE